MTVFKRPFDPKQIADPVFPIPPTDRAGYAAINSLSSTASSGGTSDPIIASSGVITNLTVTNINLTGLTGGDATLDDITADDVTVDTLTASTTVATNAQFQNTITRLLAVSGGLNENPAVIASNFNLGATSGKHTLMLEQLSEAHDRVSLAFSQRFAFETDSALAFEQDFGLYDLIAGDVERMLLDANGKFYFRNEVDVEGHFNAVTTANVSGAFRAISTSNLQGKTAVGLQSAPGAWLELPPGSASAGNAPLKMREGSRLTAPEDGAWNYDGTRLQFVAQNNWRSVSLSSDHVSTSTTVANTVTKTTVPQGVTAANSLDAQQTIILHAYGRYDVANGTDTFGVTGSMAGVDVVATSSPTAAVTGGVIAIRFICTVRSTGGGGTVWGFLEANINNQWVSVANTTTITVNMGATNTPRIQVQWSAADLGNTLSIDQSWLEIKN